MFNKGHQRNFLPHKSSHLTRGSALAFRPLLGFAGQFYSVYRYLQIRQSEKIA